MSSEFPTEVVALLEKFKFAEALEMCQDKGINGDQIKVLALEKFEEGKKKFIKDQEAGLQMFISTIGVVDPSRILCELIDPRSLTFLGKYLTELHIQGYATSKHTMLLFNMFHKNTEGSKQDSDAVFSGYLREIIDLLRSGKEITKQAVRTTSLSDMALTNLFSKFKGPKREEVILRRFIDNFDASAAIETLRQNDMDEEALEIANIMGISNHQIALMIESSHQYYEAAKSIRQMVGGNGVLALVMEFGPILLAHHPECAEQSAPIIVDTCIAMWQRDSDLDPKQFLSLFWGFPESCKEFLSRVIQRRPNELFNHALIDLVLPRKDADLRYYTPDKDMALDLLRNASPINFDMMMVLCNDADFQEGIRALLERTKRDSDIVALLIKEKNARELIQLVSNDDLKGEELFSILKFFSGEGWDIMLQNIRERNDQEDLNHANNDGENDAQNRMNPETERDIFMKTLVTKTIVSKVRPLSVIVDVLSQNKKITFEVISEVFQSEIESITSDCVDARRDYNKLTSELQELDDTINKFEENDFEMKPMECDCCKQDLEVPYIGFFCGHNIHDGCFQDEDKSTCPICRAVGKQACDSLNCIASNDKKQININADMFDQEIILVQNGFFT